MSGGTQLVGEGDYARRQAKRVVQQENLSHKHSPFRVHLLTRTALIRPQPQPYLRLASSARCRDDRNSTAVGCRAYPIRHGREVRRRPSVGRQLGSYRCASTMIFVTHTGHSSRFIGPRAPEWAQTKGRSREVSDVGLP